MEFQKFILLQNKHVILNKKVKLVLPENTTV